MRSTIKAILTWIRAFLAGVQSVVVVAARARFPTGRPKQVQLASEDIFARETASALRLVAGARSAWISASDPEALALPLIYQVARPR